MAGANVIGGGGVSVVAALRAPVRGVLRVFGRRGVEGVSIPGQEGAGAGVFVVVFLSVVEIALVDALLSAPWARVAALLAGLAVAYVMVGFAVALVACPHRLAAGKLTVSYGAAFRAEVPLHLVEEVAERRAMTGQSRTAEVSDGVLWVPVMSVTNVVLRLREPARLEAGRATGAVREIRIHAADPGAAVRAVRGALAAGPVPRPSPGAPQPSPVPRPSPAPRTGPGVAGEGPGVARLSPGVAGEAAGQAPRWLRRLRWAGLLVLLAEVVLVASGLLDWRIAAGVLAVTEGVLLVLGLVFGAAFVSGYRRLRRAGLGRRAALGGAFFSLVPPPVAEIVRHELSVWGVLARAVAFRTQQERGEARLGRAPGPGWAPVAAAVVLAAGAAGLPAWLGPAPVVLAGALVLLYAAAVAAAFAVAGRVRRHGVCGGRVVLRWGLRHMVVFPLAAVEDAGIADAAGQRSSESRFVVPGRAAGALVLRLGSPVEVPARMGALRPVMTIVVPLPDAAAARTTFLGRPEGESR
ncbi:hypothetical protein FHS38_007055 [Streptomyces netropsis]|uniref:Uncharacterized protein n=1 Tax=Streptomyces netropsis TaxID=55404 RepID=A0A7W7LJD6_STRNE|nr:hypothetical protein [Streptomyces netropsis]MBB4890962.1 hypothetical protein [Streptomyces netropsis]